MLITCVILMMIDVVMHGQGRVTWRTTRFLLIKLFCQSFCISTCLDYDHLEHYGANAQNTYRRIHKSYCSRPIHTKRCYWAVFLERIESRTLESHESLVCLVCLVCQVCQCLSWKTYTCWKKQNLKSEIWNQTAYTLCNLLNNTSTVRLKNITIRDVNCLWNKRLNTGMAPTCDWMIKIVKVNKLYLNSLLVSIVNRVSRSGTMKYQCENTDESNKKWLLT